MSEKDESENYRSKQSSKFTEEYLQRASYLGTILPLLDIFYEIVIDEKLKKYDLNIVKEFWIYFGLLVFSTIYFFFGFKLELIIFFIFATLFTLIIYNLGFFKERLIGNEDKEINKFINNIEERKTSEVTYFIKEHQNKLNESEIIKIINSSHGNFWMIYDFIFRNQKISEKILLEISKINSLKICGEGLFSKYLKSFKLGLSFNTYISLTDQFKDNEKIIKIINLYNPSYPKNRSWGLKIAKFNQSFYLSIKKGTIATVVNFISFTLVIVCLIFNYKTLIQTPYFTESLSSLSIIYAINLVFFIIIATFVFIIIFTVILLGIYRGIGFIAYISVPKKPQI